MVKPGIFALLLFWAGAAQSEAMRFTSASTGNCNGCGMVIAVGEITRDTPAAFLAFLQEEHYGEAYETLVLHSGGGDVFAGMALGRILRDAGWDTRIGDGRKTITDYEPPGPGRCRGACIFALAGGVNRRAFEQDEIIVQTLDFGEAGADVAQVQQVNARLLSYLVDMGVDPRVLFLPGEEATDIRLSFDQASAAGFVSEYGFGDWFLEPHAKGLVAASRRKGEPQLYLSVKQVTAYCRGGEPHLLVTSDRALVDYLTRADAPEVPGWHLGEMRATGDGASLELASDRVRRWHDDAHVYHEINLTSEAARLILGEGEKSSYFAYWHHHDGIGADISPGPMGRKMIALSFRHCLS